jgi:nucleoside 2-deoxyribosyltransferase
MKKIYLIGALKNPNIPALAIQLRCFGYDVFDDWFSPGHRADEHWQNYEKERGRTYVEAIKGYHAKHALAFDKFHLDRCDIAINVMPSGKSAGIEMGYILGQGKPAYVLLDGEPERYDLMYGMATDIFENKEQLLKCLGG